MLVRFRWHVAFAVDLLVFGENWLIVKISRGIVWSEGLLLGTSGVGSYVEKWQCK